MISGPESARRATNRGSAGAGTGQGVSEAQTSEPVTGEIPTANTMPNGTIENVERWPGSKGADKDGCLCPVMDNGGHPKGWRISRQDCPLHGWGSA